MPFVNRLRITEKGRQCSRCKVFKPWNAFAKNRHGTRGHQSWCSECFRIYEGRTKREEYIITEEGRECSRCGEFKSWDQFHRRNDVSTGYMSACKACIKKKYRGEKNEGKIRNRELVRKYGITLDEYNRMLEGQGGTCAICAATETSVRNNGRVCYLSVDHDHKTGKIRGLLCQKCNAIIGLADDDVSMLERAIEYLEENGK